MPLEDAFWQDILENPGDDAPRLIFADWLEEQGDSGSRDLAEFIRVQIELEQPLEEGPRLWALKQREEELLRAHRAEWVGPLRELVLGEEFRRGFVESVTLTPRHFLERAETVLGLAPVRRLRLFGTAGQGEEAVDHGVLLARIAQSPFLGQFTSLRWQGPLSLDGARALAGSPHLVQLQDLEIACPELSESGLLVLLVCPQVVRLRRLVLQASRFAPDALQRLAACPALAGLVELTVHTGALDLDAELRALAVSEHLRGLRKLDLSHNRIGPNGIAALAEGPLVNQLEELLLANNQVGEEGLIAWSSRARGAEALARSPSDPTYQPPRLKRLDLAHNQIYALGIEALSCSPSLRELTKLDLRGNVVGDGLSALAESEYAENLRVLLLHFNGIRDEAVRALARSEHLRELVWLDLRANRITSAGAGALARSPHLRKIARLQLERNDIDENMAQELIDRFGSCVTV